MYHPVTPQTPQSYLKTITLIHIALFLGQLLFAFVVLFITPHKSLNFNDTKNPLFIVVPLMAVGSLAGGIALYKKMVEKAKGKYSLKEKLMAYQGALIQRYALLNGTSMLAIVTYMVGGNLFFIIIAGVLMICLLAIRPTKDKIVTELDLSYEDKITFDSQEILQ